jgi:predicted amidohydrolase
VVLEITSRAAFKYLSAGVIYQSSRAIPMKKITIACLQMASSPYDCEKNLEKATSMIHEAAENGANICILPEVFNPGYSLDDENFLKAETLEGPTITQFKQLAAELNIYITGGLGEITGKEYFNTMFFIGPGGLMATYHKKHVFSLENKYWKRGKNATIVNTEFGDIGLGICADMHYAKMWQEYAGKIDLALICSAWPDRPEKTRTRYGDHEAELCRDLPAQISRSMQIPVAYCNATQDCKGKVPVLGRMYCQGNSKIVDKGKIVATIESRENRVLLGTVEIADLRPVIEASVFKHWIKHTITENLLRFLVEGILTRHGKMYYALTKKKYLRTS